MNTDEPFIPENEKIKENEFEFNWYVEKFFMLFHVNMHHSKSKKSIRLLFVQILAEGCMLDPPNQSRISAPPKKTLDSHST